MISERTLRQWRRDSLKLNQIERTDEEKLLHYQDLNERILRLTQELMDIHLVKKG